MSDPLPENWVEVPIGEIAHINPPLDRCLLDENTEITFLGMSSVLPEHRGISEPGLRPYREVSKGYTRFVEGDVLVAKITPCMENGKVVVAAPLTNTIGCGSTEFHVFRPRPGIDPGWISRFLWRSDIRHLAKTHMTGAVGQQRVPTGFFEDLTIPVPSTSEQRRIIPILDDTLAKIDEAEEALERVRRNLDRYRASVLKAACEGRLVPTEAELARQQGRDYEPASQLLQRILIARREAWEKAQLEAYAKKDRTPPKDWKSRYPESQAPNTSDLPDLPEGSCWANVDQISLVDIGFAFKSAEFVNAGIRLLRGENLEPGALRWKDTRYWPEDKMEDFEDLLIQEGQIILAMDRPVVSAGLKIARAKSSDLPCLLVQRMARVRPLLPEMNAYLYQMLNSRAFIKHLAGNQTGTQLPHISGDAIRSFPMPLAPIQEQARIIEELDRITTMSGQIEVSAQTSSSKCHTLRQSLLKHSFSGKLVPQDPADEPASALLERIRTQRLEMEGGTTPRKRAIRKTKKSS